jgi:hypothetical protein
MKATSTAHPEQRADVLGDYRGKCLPLNKTIRYGDPKQTKQEENVASGQLKEEGFEFAPTQTKHFGVVHHESKHQEL